MKSILAKQAPQRRPWLPIRVRQTMHTGGRKRLASVPATNRTEPVVAKPDPVSLMAMAAIIKRMRGSLEDEMCEAQ